MDEKEIGLSFSFTDEFGETTTLNKTYQDNEEVGKIWWLLEEFKCFYTLMGFIKLQLTTLFILKKAKKL